jgi:hypothetical protein
MPLRNVGARSDAPIPKRRKPSLLKAAGFPLPCLLREEALERLAASEQRTLASYVHFVLHQHVEAQAGNKSRKSPR